MIRTAVLSVLVLAASGCLDTISSNTDRPEMAVGQSPSPDLDLDPNPIATADGGTEVTDAGEPEVDASEPDVADGGPAEEPVDAGVPPDDLPSTCALGEPCDDGDPCTLDDACDAEGECLGGPEYISTPESADTEYGVCNPTGALEGLDGQVTGLGSSGLPFGTIAEGYEGAQCIVLDFGQVQPILRLTVRAFATLTPCSLIVDECAEEDCLGESSLVGAWAVADEEWNEPFQIAGIAEPETGVYGVSYEEPIEARYLLLCRDNDPDVTLDVALDEVVVEAVEDGPTCVPSGF
tara:strand:+ start:2946 stop:3824 length:879 start_codon:yes stop_codon:yes gene_type:complete